jgi:hypothetical protein
MRRREFVVFGASLISAGGCSPLGQDFDSPEFEQLRRDFPYEVVEVSGARAWQEWSRLRDLGRGWPIILGGEEDFLRVAEGVVGFVGDPVGVRQVDDILAAASRLEHPASLLQSIREEYARYGDAPPEAELGEWPDVPPLGTGLTVPFDILTGQPYERVYIVILPTQDGTEAPAYLRWGGWNECPPPEYHVAAFKSWRDRYGVVPVAMAGDVLNLVASSRPSSRDEAMALAREQYAYCTDIVDQGVENLSNLAATLSTQDWWYFWWD